MHLDNPGDIRDSNIQEQMEQQQQRRYNKSLIVAVGPTSALE